MRASSEARMTTSGATSCGSIHGTPRGVLASICRGLRRADSPRWRGEPGQAPNRPRRDQVHQGVFYFCKPIGVICHGPWSLVEADVVRGRTLTSWPSVRTDIRNAGGNVVDEQVVTDQNLTSSRWPDDLPA